jgi:hypothetical protein
MLRCSTRRPNPDGVNGHAFESGPHRSARRSTDPKCCEQNENVLSGDIFQEPIRPCRSPLAAQMNSLGSSAKQ